MSTTARLPIRQIEVRVLSQAESRKLGRFKERNIEQYWREQRLLGTFPVTFSDELSCIKSCTFVWARTVSLFSIYLFSRNLFGTCHYTFTGTLLITTVWYFLYRSSIARLVSRLLEHLPRFAVYQIRIRQFASRHLNLINLWSRFNFLKATQQSNMTHYRVLTNSKHFWEVWKALRFQEISWGCNDNSVVYIREYHPTTN